MYNCIDTPPPLPPEPPSPPPEPPLPPGWDSDWVTINGSRQGPGSVFPVPKTTPVGQVTTWPFVLYNKGSAVWNYSVQPMDQSGGLYKLTGPLQGSIKPGEYQVLQLSFNHTGGRAQWQCYVEGIPNDPHHHIQVELNVG